MVAVIERDIDSKLGACVKEPLAAGIFAYRQYEIRRFKPRRDRVPALAVIARAIDVRRTVVHTMAFNRGVGDACSEVRWLDEGDLTPWLHSGWRHIDPGLATVARQRDDSCVAARPQDVFVEIGWRDRCQRAVALHDRLLGCRYGCTFHRVSG